MVHLQRWVLIAMKDVSNLSKPELEKVLKAADTILGVMGLDGTYPLPKGYSHDFAGLVLDNDGLPTDLYEAAKVLDLAVTGNGAFFNRAETGFLPEIIADIFKERTTTKKAMLAAERQYVETHDEEHKTTQKKLDIKQKALKVTLNSAYGSIANRHFRFFDKRQSEAVTLSGVLIIKWAIVFSNRFLNEYFGTVDEDYVIASDTDSIYLSLEKAVPPGATTNEAIEILDKLANGPLEKAMADAFSRLCDMTNGLAPKIWMKRESIANPGIWTGAKYYMLSVLDDEGVRYTTPKIKIVGLAAIRSTTPEMVRKRLRTAIKIMMWKDEKKLQEYVELFRNRFYRSPFEKVAQPSSVSTLGKYITEDGLGWKPRAPAAVKGAIVYNRTVKELGLEKECEPILPGGKVKWCYLKSPNPVRCELIAVPSELPVEFGLEDYIDYDKQFETVFLRPLRSYCQAIGWRVEETADLFEMLFRNGGELSGDSVERGHDQNVDGSTDDPNPDDLYELIDL